MYLVCIKRKKAGKYPKFLSVQQVLRKNKSFSVKKLRHNFMLRHRHLSANRQSEHCASGILAWVGDRCIVWHVSVRPLAEYTVPKTIAHT